jgi:hypothetical protein
MAFDKTVQNKINDITFAVAYGLHLEESPDSDWPEAQWREWVDTYYEQASAIIDLLNARSALDSAAKKIAAAHAAAADTIVKAPTASDIQSLTNRLLAVNDAVADDQSFHAALDIFEALAKAVPTKKG